MTTSPPVDDVRLMMLKGIYKSGPSDDELIRLPDLVLQVSEFYGMVGPVSIEKAATLVIGALLGYGEWAGMAPERLDLYRLTSQGNELVSASVDCAALGCEDAPKCGHKSDRSLALDWLPLKVIMGDSLAELGSGPYIASPPPRFLAVLRDEALRAFGLTPIEAAPDESASWQGRALELASKGMKPTAIAKELGLARLLNMPDDTARKKVERLIASSEKQEIERKKAEAFKKQVQHIQGAAGG